MVDVESFYPGVASDVPSEWLLSSFLPPPFNIVFMSSLAFPLSQPDNPGVLTKHLDFFVISAFALF